MRLCLTRSHQVVAADDLEDAVHAVVGELLKCAPQALDGAKQLVHDLLDAEVDEAQALPRDAITDARASENGREGLGAFLEKRKPGWLA